MTRIYGFNGEPSLYVSGPSEDGWWYVENGHWWLVPLANGKFCVAGKMDYEFALDLLMEPAPNVKGDYNAVLYAAAVHLASPHYEI
jgi:hypothetical protein